MKRHLCAACLAAYFAFSSVQPVGALTVFDPSNYSQNVLQAARALQQINNQIQSLQNQVLMLQNMAQNLQRLDRSEEHTSELQSLMRNSYAVFRMKKKYIHNNTITQISEISKI